MEIPFVGGSYEGRSKDVSSQKAINCYPVTSSDREGNKVPVYLQGTPGLLEWADLSSSNPVRGLHVFGSNLYAVCGDTVYEVDTEGTATALTGTLGTSTGYCWMENNDTGNDMVIVDGSSGYIFASGGDSIAQIADADFPGAAALTYQDGYFIVVNPSTGQFFVSDSYDGANWTATYFATAEGWPDDLLSLLSDHRELWLFGSETTEVWYNSGSGSPPFSRKIDEIIQRGIGATASAVRFDNTVAWLDDKGRAVRAEGYRPVRISTDQVEYQWSSYSSISDAIGFVYTQEGHEFWVLTFPTGNATWVYDAASGFWHERQSYPNTGTTHTRWRGNCYAYFDNKHLVGDYSNGKIYEQDFDTYTDNSQIQRFVRSSPHIHKDRENIFYGSLEIDIESGVGTQTGQGNDPQAMLRYSDDGGHTWSNELWTDMGKAGEYTTRAKWNKLGRSRSRVFELTITDPVKRVVLGAHARVSMGKQ